MQEVIEFDYHVFERLDKEDMQYIKKLARKKGISVETLLHSILTNHLKCYLSNIKTFRVMGIK